VVESATFEVCRAASLVCGNSDIECIGHGCSARERQVQNARLNFFYAEDRFGLAATLSIGIRHLGAGRGDNQGDLHVASPRHAGER
jgi:hypothetical protein